MKFEPFLSNFFIVSIILASSLILIGGGIVLYHDHQEVGRHIFLGNPQQINGILPLIGPSIHGNPIALIELGTFILLITPILRVLFCNIYFLTQKEVYYFSFTTFSLILLILSSLGFIKMS